MGGYGKILTVDLTTRITEERQLEPELIKSYIGGSGLAAKLLFEMTGPDTDPLGMDNPLIILTGPLTGTPAPASGRHTVVAKSPLTGIWGEGNIGGSWGRALRKAGYDGIICTGASDVPVYIWMNNGQVEFRDAAHLWGKDTFETNECIRRETHELAKVSCIGPAGENLVAMSGIFTDGDEGRTAARCGLGAVQGSKRLKAIAVYGTEKVFVSRPDQLKEILSPIRPLIREKTAYLNELGTAGLVIPCELTGSLPLENWKGGSWPEGAQKISGQKMNETILTGKSHCVGCPIGCGRKIAFESSRFGKVAGGGPEYETLGCLGSNCLIDDLEAISYLNELCNRFGLDTIDVGNAAAMAIEAFERGVLTLDDTGGVALCWGDTEAVGELIKQIAFKKHVGAILGQGIRRAATHYGGLMKEMAIEVKGLSFASHDPRAYNSLAVGYATSNRGACHLQAFSHPFERSLSMPELGIETQDRFGVEGKGEMVAKLQDLMAIFDSLSLCKFLVFGGVTVTDMLHWFNAVTGCDLTLEDFLAAGERAFVLKRLYNVRMGISRKDDCLPSRILMDRRKTGGAAENLPPLDRMLTDYYCYRQWDEEGIPTPEKVDQLGLSWTKEYVTV